MAKVKTYWEEKLVKSGFMPFHTTTSYKDLGSKTLDSNNLPKVGDKVVREHVILKRYQMLQDGFKIVMYDNIVSTYSTINRRINV